MAEFKINIVLLISIMYEPNRKNIADLFGSWVVSCESYYTLPEPMNIYYTSPGTNHALLLKQGCSGSRPFTLLRFVFVDF